MRNKMLARVKKSLNYAYYRYSLETHVYMFEPWERALVNSVFLIILSLVFLISYFYVPVVIGTMKSVVPPLPQWFETSSIKMQTDDL